MTNAYAVTFRTAAEYAMLDIEAASVEEALQRAQAQWDDDLLSLDFSSYDWLHPLQNITVKGPGADDPVEWQAPDFALKYAAPDLLDALRQAVEALNTAPQFDVPGLDTDSYAIASLCERAIARTKGGVQ